MNIDWSDIFAEITGTADERTRQKVEAWKKRGRNNHLFYQQASAYYEGEPAHNKRFSEAELDNIYREVQKKRTYRYRRVWSRRIGTVAALAALSLGAWMYYTSNSHKTYLNEENIREAVVIVQENGRMEKVIEDGQKGSERLSYVTERKNATVDTLEKRDKKVMHTIVVPRGRTFEVELSDGTIVILDPMSEFTYPVVFDSLSAREVTLRGEAYFAVAHSQRRFIVHTERMKLQVYGTHFNVISRNTMCDEVILVEGRVGVSALGISEVDEVILQPGERSFVNAEGSISVEKIDVLEYIAKHNGYILFNGKSLYQILDDMAMYYDVEFIVGEEFADRDLNTKEYVYSFKRDSSLREALDALETVLEVSFIIKGKEVQVTAKD